jgi:TonB family protein
MSVTALLLALIVSVRPLHLGACAQANVGDASPADCVAGSDCLRRPRQAAQPKGSPTRWLTLDDYPAQAIREARGGTVKYNLTIRADGKPRKCAVTSSSGDENLDEYTCSIMMRRARFCPATDSKSRPIEGSWTGGVTWKIPNEW